MKVRLSLAAAVLVLAVLRVAPTTASSHESLADLADHFAKQGLELLAGQKSMRVEGGVVGVFAGTVRQGETKPYVLIVAGPPAGMAAMGALVDIGRDGIDFNGHPLPPLLQSPGRHVIVAYLEDPGADGEGLVPLESVAAYIDLAALAGGSGMHVEIKSAASSAVWMRFIEQSNIPLGLNLEVHEPPDLEWPRAKAYSKRQIPGLQFGGGVHATPQGNELRYVAASTLAASIAAKVSRLQEPPPFQRVDRSSETNTPKSKRPSTGTIPDYTADVEGLLLEGVVEGGPAEAAGLQAGDVIIELAGNEINDVYTYADVLDTLEIGVPITVVFLRDAERLETTLTPQGR